EKGRVDPPVKPYSACPHEPLACARILSESIQYEKPHTTLLPLIPRPLTTDIAHTMISNSPTFTCVYTYSLPPLSCTQASSTLIRTPYFPLLVRRNAYTQILIIYILPTNVSNSTTIVRHLDMLRPTSAFLTDPVEASHFPIVSHTSALNHGYCTYYDF
ncbi:hypothetical protein J6590_079066, partial [Homalodisca vitripennis]